MADEILRSKHAFGDFANLDKAIADGKIDAYDILFLDGKTEPKIGWVDKDGNVIILEDKKQVMVVDSLPETGNEDTIYICGSTFYFWNGSEFVASADNAGVSEDFVNARFDDAVSEANAYTDEKLADELEAYLSKKYEIANVPEGTLVDYGDHEIRIMIPENTVWTKQSVGVGGDPNSYYVTLKTYFTDDEVVGYIEHLGDQVDAEILKDIKVDENGRRYQPSWLAVAKYDEATGVWSYYGALSNEEKYIGWDYRLDQFNANDVMIASDGVRINLSNENCHSSIVPYYVKGAIGNATAKANDYTDKKIAEVASGYEIVEF